MSGPRNKVSCAFSLAITDPQETVEVRAEDSNNGLWDPNLSGRTEQKIPHILFADLFA